MESGYGIGRKAIFCLKDGEHLNLRTTNPIESTFATVKVRTTKTRGCLFRQTMLTMIFKLYRSAERGTGIGESRREQLPPLPTDPAPVVDSTRIGSVPYII